MRLVKKSKTIANNVGDILVDVLHSKTWMGCLWIGLGLATWFNSQLTDFISIVGPILVGVLLMIPINHRDMLYFVGGFAVVADRVLAYLEHGFWNPLFVWLMVGTYVLNAMERER